METEVFEYEVQAVEDRLEDYILNEEEIDQQIERLEYLTSKMTSISSQVLTGMPSAPSVSTDRMADMLSRKEELETSIREAIQKQSIERTYLEGIVKKLRKPEQRAVIRLRYFDKLEWDEVLEAMYSNKEDFDERRESYERKMYRKRREAITGIAIILRR